MILVDFTSRPVSNISLDVPGPAQFAFPREGMAGAVGSAGPSTLDLIGSDAGYAPLSARGDREPHDTHCSGSAMGSALTGRYRGTGALHGVGRTKGAVLARPRQPNPIFHQAISRGFTYTYSSQQHHLQRREVLMRTGGCCVSPVCDVVAVVRTRRGIAAHGGSQSASVCCFAGTVS